MGNKFYGPALPNGAFYDDAESPEIPKDAVAISDEDYEALKAGLAIGGRIEITDGKIVFFAQTEPSRDEQVAAIQSYRAAAYRAEADPLYMEWQYDQTDLSEKTWRDKVAEIKKRFPLPA